MTIKYLVKDKTGNVYIYTRYLSGNCTRKNLTTGEQTAQRIPVTKYETDLRSMTILSKM